ncbi:MAG: STAS domain-containing protein, partial [Actinomycetota bacterium]|nr:STAS domain-containing protein [Actinomycetota bacterium]
MAPQDLPALCATARALLARSDSILCDVRGLECADLQTIDVLARLQLTVKRLGGSLRLRGTTGELDELLNLVGLRDALGVEPVGEPEQREEPLGVEEEADPGDL